MNRYECFFVILLLFLEILHKVLVVVNHTIINLLRELLFIFINLSLTVDQAFLSSFEQ